VRADERVGWPRDGAKDDEGKASGVVVLARRDDGGEGFKDGFGCFKGLIAGGCKEVFSCC
jgi:hypothetical protein